MNHFSRRNLKVFLLLSAIVLTGLFFRTKHLYHDIDGSHVFRQTQVASNIYYFLENGISIPAEAFMKNGNYRILDFPLYQHLVTAICASLNADVVLAGRALNILIYVLTSLTLYSIMIHLGIRIRLILIVLFLYSLSPLNIFYNRAIIPDNLAILLGFLSLLYFLRWSTQASNQTYSYVGIIAAGVAATLIKSPIYLPVMIAIMTHLILIGQWRKLFSPGVIVFLGTILTTVALFKLYTNYVNFGSFSTPTLEYGWYFGEMAGRTNLSSYKILGKRFIYEVVPPPFFMFFLLGVPLYILNCKDRHRYLFLGLSLGLMVTTLTFFNLNVIHNYYQLPHIFITCFFAGYFIEWYYMQYEKSNTFDKTIWTITTRSIVWLCFICLAILLAHRYMLPMEEPRDRIAAGSLIDASTPPNGFVLYVTGRSGPDPSYLYYSKRNGYNVGVNQLSSTAIRDKLRVFEASYKGMYLYVPKSVHVTNMKGLQEYDRRLVAESSDGVLFKLEEKAHRVGRWGE